jgi:hypothetical protein
MIQITSRKLYCNFADNLNICTHQEGCGLNFVVFMGLFGLEQEIKEKNHVFLYAGYALQEHHSRNEVSHSVIICKFYSLI